MQDIESYKLVDISDKHKSIILQWRNSDHIRMNMINSSLITKKEHSKWFKNLHRDKSIIAKVFTHNDEPLGFVNFTDIDYLNSKCEWGFYIGKKNAAKGSGKIMGILALDFLFDSIGIRKLYSSVLDFNNISIHYHKKFGFVEEGRLKKHILRGANYSDIVLMAMFKDNWAANKEQLFIEMSSYTDDTGN